MDALSEALRSVRMTGAIFLDAEFTAPWSFRSPLAQQAAPVVAPGTEQLIIYHLVIDGMAWVKIAGEPDLPVEAGEIVIIPHGEEHLFGNGTPDTVFDGAATLHRHVAGELSSLRWGGGGVMTKFVCGFMGCERQAESLFLAGLPTTIKINIRGDASGGVAGELYPLSRLGRPISPAWPQHPPVEDGRGIVHRDPALLHQAASA
jgi:Cupin